MNDLKFWLKAVLFDVAIAIALIAWKGHGIEGAGNIVVTWLWFASSLLLLVGLLGDKTMVKQARPVGFKTYHVAKEAALFFVLTFYGLIGLSLFRVVSLMLCEGARTREPKAKKGEV